jgi:hypothetical protein
MKGFKLKSLVTLMITLLFVSAQVTPSAATSHKPTLAQIEAAKKAELAKKKSQMKPLRNWRAQKVI